MKHDVLEGIDNSEESRYEIIETPTVIVMIIFPCLIREVHADR